MKENEEKHIDRLIEGVMKKSTLEITSHDFTSLVMQQVEALKKNAYTTYDPLISKRAWVMIISISIIFFSSVIMLGKIQTSGWFGALNLDFMHSVVISEIFNGIKPSKAMNISITVFALMLLIQIPLLKHYFDKRIIN